MLGSNLGDSRGYLARAVELLGVSVGKVEMFSSVQTSVAWGYASECVYFNQIIVCDTDLEPLEVLERCEAVEFTLGRMKAVGVDWRGEREYQDRVIDVDILYFFDEQGCSVPYEDERLLVPHARIGERDFVKVLLDEVFSIADGAF